MINEGGKEGGRNEQVRTWPQTESSSLKEVSVLLLKDLPLIESGPDNLLLKVK